MFALNRQFFSLLVVLLSISSALAQEPRKDLYGDPLPAGAVARIGTIRLRNAGEISKVALGGDGKYLITTDEGLLRVWDAKTGAFVREILSPLDDTEVNTPGPQPRGRIAALTFPPGEKRLYVLTQRRNLYICDIADGTCSNPLARSGVPGDQFPHTLGPLTPDAPH